MEQVKREDMVRELSQMGVASGDLLLSHSSFKSFGPVAGGPGTIAGALVEVVSPDGSAFVPTFNFGELPYDPVETRSLTGAITEVFRKLPGAVRSLHPTHPVAGIGRAADEILKDHDKTNSFGEGSPLWRLYERNAWVLLIGVDQTVNSTIHVAEEVLQIPYIHRTRAARIIRGNATIEVIVRRPGCSNGFNKIDPVLRSAGNIIDGKVGNAKLMLMRSRTIVNAAVKMLQRDPTALLCDEENCSTCAEARRILDAQNSE